MSHSFIFEHRREEDSTLAKLFKYDCNASVFMSGSHNLLQIVPHVTNAIQDWIERVSKIPVDDTDEEPDVCIVEASIPRRIFPSSN